MARSDYEVLKAEGVRIDSLHGQFTVYPEVHQDPESIGPVDLVLIGLKTTANAEAFHKLLPPLVGPSTILLTLQNGLGSEDQLAMLFGKERIYGGLCFVCLNRTAPGCIHHMAHGLIMMGRHAGPANRTLRRMGEAFDQAGIPVSIAEDLDRAHWEKLVWNIPFNGLGVALAAGVDALESGRFPDSFGEIGSTWDTSRLLSDPQGEEWVRALMLEVVRAAAALGHHLPEDLPDRQIRNTREMGAYLASTLVDFERGLPLEIQSLFEEPLRRALSAGCEMPRLSRLCSLLSHLDCMRRGNAEGAS